MDPSSRSPRASHAGKWWTAAAILPGQLTIAFGMFGVVVALPNIMTAFAADVDAVQWVMTSYLIARVVPMPALGWLSSALGNRNLYMLGVLGTTLSTMLCGLSWDMASLIVFRVIQGALGAQVMGLGMVMLYEAFPPHQRGLAMGLFILVASLGPTLGQLIGGYLVQEMSWRAIFFLAVPSGIVGTLLTLSRIPPDAPRGSKTLDVPGLCTMTVFLVTLLLALSQGQRVGWDTAWIHSLFALSGLFFGLFLMIERRVPHPVVHLQLYRNRHFVMASVVTFLYNAGFMGANFLLALMLQLVFDFTPVQSGLVLAPGAIVMGLIGFGSGRLADQIEPRYLVVAGLACFALNMYYFASLSLLSSLGSIACLAVFQRGSFGMIFSASDTAVMRTLPEPERSMGSGLHNMHRGIAMAFGVAFSSLLLEKRLAYHSLWYGEIHERFAPPVQESLAMLQQLLKAAGETGQTAASKALAALAGLMTEQARIAAYQDCFLILTAVFLLALLPAWWTRTHTASGRTAAPSTAPPPTPVAVLTLPAGEVWDEEDCPSRSALQTLRLSNARALTRAKEAHS
ncbi:MAG: DHA2 family efflux MFS transporter permease subunit [Candidatus Tectimicrobiota bacterium]